MYLQTPKRPVLPPTPVSYNNNKTSLPPLSSILGGGESGMMTTKLPSMDSFTSTPTTSKLYEASLPSGGAKPMKGFVTPRDADPRGSSVAGGMGSADSSEVDISVCDMKEARAKQKFQVPMAAGAESKSYAFISHSPATFPSQEPSIDNAPLARRKRRRTSPNELSILNSEFDNGSTPNKSRRMEIAKRVSMTEKAVQIWFQNKRQSLRKQSTHEKEITELPPTPPITGSMLISSTPIKPDIHKTQSFIEPTPGLMSPIEQRSNSLPIFSKPQNPVIATPSAKKLVTNEITPNSSFNVDESNDSSMSTLVLNETKKKQPEFLNSTSSSTMTFKLTPTAGKVTSKVNQRLNTIDNKENEGKTSINSLLNVSNTTSALNSSQSSLSTHAYSNPSAPGARNPLSEINTNKASKGAKPKDNECIENLLSLRTGNWKWKVVPQSK